MGSSRSILPGQHFASRKIENFWTDRGRAPKTPLKSNNNVTCGGKCRCLQYIYNSWSGGYFWNINSNLLCYAANTSKKDHFELNSLNLSVTAPPLACKHLKLAFVGKYNACLCDRRVPLSPPFSCWESQRKPAAEIGRSPHKVARPIQASGSEPSLACHFFRLLLSLKLLL